MTGLVPFGPAAGESISGLDVETDEDSIVVSGTLTALRDRRGLADLRRLAAIVDAAVAALEAATDLPETAPPPPKGGRVPNPFA